MSVSVIIPAYNRATLLPFKGAFYWTPAGERKRDALNRWILHSGAFDSVMSYFTAAWVAEVSFTERTLDATPDASGLAESEEIAEENSEPFCSRATRLLVGVDELKNSSQLAVISAAALPEPPLAGALELAGSLELAGADDVTNVGVLGVLEDEEELALLEQADSAVASTRPRAGAR